MLNFSKIRIYTLVFFICVTLTCQPSFSQEREKIIDHLNNSELPLKIHLIENEINFAMMKIDQNSAPDSFYIIDLAKVSRSYNLWVNNLPKVVPYYAVKCNSDPVLIKTLVLLGANFDCASISEIRYVLASGATPDRIIFAHPRKSPSEILEAYKLGISRMTFDSIEELDKMSKLAPQSEFILRVKGKDHHSYIPMSDKFGATSIEAQNILGYALDRNLKVIGISFHIGDTATSATPYQETLKEIATLFAFAKNRFGITMKLLDLGGGFPGNDEELFVAIAQEIRKIINKDFSDKIEVIAEPGRFFATSSVTSFMRVLGKKKYTDSHGETRFEYFMSDGSYGTYHSAFYYHNDSKRMHKKFNFKPLVMRGDASYKSALWGATCDSGDIITKEIRLPELRLNDYLYASNSGAYSISTSSSFNKITKPETYYIYSSGK